MEKLTIRNFGPINDVDLVLRRINVFVGEQGVGKSTVAKLLTFLRDSMAHLFIFQKKQSSLELLMNIMGISTYFRPDSFIDYHDEDTSLSVRYSDGNFSINISRIDSDYDAIGSYLIYKAGKPIKAELVKMGIADEDMVQYIEKGEQLHFLSALSRASLYCPAERGMLGTLSSSLASIIMANVPLPEMLLSYMSFYEKAKRKFPTYEVDFLGLRFETRDNEDIIIDRSGAMVPIKFASSGIQSILPLMMVIDYCEHEDYFNSFTVEEPELNLFPTNQRELIHFILSRSVRTGLGPSIELTLTTHSPYLLSILNISILAGKIVRKFPDAKEKINDILSEKYHIQPDEISVYSLDALNGYRNILSDETGLIDGNYLDSVSEIIASDFGKLQNLYLTLLTNQAG